MEDVSLKTIAGCRLILKDVRHSPNIRVTLISTRKLDDEGYTTTMVKENV